MCSIFFIRCRDIRKKCHDRVLQSLVDKVSQISRHCNLVELMELLMFMQQKMKERDNQSKTQLQLRDKYLDAELKRRDQDDALNKRDEEWKVEIEKRDTEWRIVLRDRDNALKVNMDSRDNNCMNNLGHGK